MPPPVYHALGLTMHQPLGNLIALHNSSHPWEAREVLSCYRRVTEALNPLSDVARIHLAFSGTLLKQFEDPAIAETFADVIDIQDMLNNYQQAHYIEYLGSGLYHPVFPLIPEADWDAQGGWWHGLGKKLLGRERYPGFCPPEIGFCQPMVPMLERMGYRYVLVDCAYIKPRRRMRWEELRYRPYVTRYQDASIIVVPIDRELSNAQLSGTSPDWFENEIRERTKFCDFPALVTTWSDGENGGWFRNADLNASFWGHFFCPLLERFREQRLSFRPVSINEYLDLHGPGEEVDVHAGAWNTGEHWGGDFTQWTGSLLQKRGFDEIERASAYHRELRTKHTAANLAEPEIQRAGQLIHNAYDLLLRAQTSCNFFWGSRWVHRTFDDLEQVYCLLDQASQSLKEHCKGRLKYASLARYLCRRNLD